MLDNLDQLIAEYAALETQLADPQLHNDQAKAREAGKRFAELGPIVAAAKDYKLAISDLADARELAKEDAEYGSEIPSLEAKIEQLTATLKVLLLPKDPNDDKDVILEVKAGEGGEESALFASDLLRMYQRYAERQGWKTELLDSTDSDMGGYKEASMAIKSKKGGVWEKLKFEGGVHRVQRVPATETQGRIHTSAAGVLVFPEAEEVDVEISPNDLRIDVYRSGGPGGQSVNTTDSAVRITHVPTGIVAQCQNEKSQLQNKESAMRILRARILDAAQQAADAEASAQRASQVRTVDRSERIRTYNFAENRIADHRTGFKAYNLDAVLQGDLDAVIQSLIDADTTASLAGAGE